MKGQAPGAALKLREEMKISVKEGKPSVGHLPVIPALQETEAEGSTVCTSVWRRRSSVLRLWVQLPVPLKERKAGIS